MKIKDKLYKYQGFGKFAEYICTAIIKREKLVMYELECQNCNHGWKCKILVKRGKNKQEYEFVAMVNDEEEEYEAFHTTLQPNERFFVNLEDAKKAVYLNAINFKKSEIEKHKKVLKRSEKELQELEAHFKNITKQGGSALTSGSPHPMEIGGTS